MKAISLNQIAKEEIKGTGYEIRVNGQKVVSEKGMPDRFYGEIRILKPVIDRDYMLVSDGMTEKAITGNNQSEDIQSASGQSKAGGRTEKENAGSARGDHGHY